MWFVLMYWSLKSGFALWCRSVQVPASCVGEEETNVWQINEHIRPCHWGRPRTGTPGHQIILVITQITHRNDNVSVTHFNTEWGFFWIYVNKLVELRVEDMQICLYLIWFLCLKCLELWCQCLLDVFHYCWYKCCFCFLAGSVSEE